MGGLQPNWLAAELADSENTLASWSPELRASFASLFDELKINEHNSPELFDMNEIGISNSLSEQIL